ncbi:MAG TPA: hypothetical protein VFS58_03450 [Steroidobacteraceae bacterium]|nr:hypothetical protein [Steroidobacteraceae bacterium]
MSSEGIMRRARRLYFASLLALIIPAVFAQSPPARNRDDLDVTMHVIVDPDAKVPDEIVRRIPLPKPVQPAAGDTSTPGDKGQKPAPGASGQGREFGQQVSEDAKRRAEEAKNNKKPKPEKPPSRPPSPPGRPPTPGG